MSKYDPHLSSEQMNEKLLDIVHYIKSTLGDGYGVLLIVRDDDCFFAHKETDGCGGFCNHEVDSVITNCNEESAEHLAQCWIDGHYNRRQIFSEKGN